jgi:hypothetical protein
MSSGTHRRSTARATTYLVLRDAPALPRALLAQLALVLVCGEVASGEVLAAKQHRGQARRRRADERNKRWSRDVVGAWLRVRAPG